MFYPFYSFFRKMIKVIYLKSLGRLGAKVIGIDSNENSYEVALNHLNSYEGRELGFMK